VLFLLFISYADAAGSVLGIDFGTLNLKAALVKPGIPLEIVLTKDSKRKETAAVAFKPNRDSNNNFITELGSYPERLYGGDALALQGRFPGEVFPNLKPLLRLEASEGAAGTIHLYHERYPAVQVRETQETGTAAIKSASFVADEASWSIEELLAMQFGNMKRNAESMAGRGSSVGDAVISIPPFYTAEEKRAIVRAAQLAGLDVNALMSDGLAVGVDYAKSRTFPEVSKGDKPEHHLVFDMGAGSTTATVLRFQSRSVKDVGRYNKTVQEVAVLGAGWDRTMGGDSLTQVVVEDYISKLLQKPDVQGRGVTRQDIAKNGRAMSRLWKDAEKARQVISANTETSSSFEELLPDVDFRAKLSRAEFESMTTAFASRVSKPIEDALALAGLGMKDIDSIILYGGAVRTPFVQKKLEEIAGGSAKLRSNVNADESAVFGAAFKGAGLSPSFKVKEIRDSDVAYHPMGMVYRDGDKERRQLLFNALSPVGSGASTKQVTFKDKDDFTFSFYQQVGEANNLITKIETLNLTAGVKELKSKFDCEKEDISTKFSVKLSPIDGLPTVSGASLSCEVDGVAKGESLGDSVKDWLGFGKKKDQDSLADGEEDTGPTEAVEASMSTASGISNSESTTTTPLPKAPEKPKKRVESIAIAFTAAPVGESHASIEDMQRMRDRLAAFDRSDRARTAREEALNVLEAYTYRARDFLDNADYNEVSTSKQRDAISKLLASTREFMDSPKEIGKATRQVLSEKLKALTDLIEPIQMRRQEELSRPEMISALRNTLDQTQKLVEMVQEQVQMAEASKKKAEEFDASQAAAAAASATLSAAADEPKTTSVDDLADLEEPDTAGGSSAERGTIPPASKYSAASDFSPYTNLDLTELKEAHASVLAWLEGKETEQAKLKPHEEPVLLVKEVEQKADQLGGIMKDLLYKKMRATAKSTKAKTTKTSKAKSTKKSTKKSKSGDEEATAAGEQPPFITFNPGDGMPSEEEIMRMVSEATEKQKKASSTGHVVDEL